MAGVNLHRTHTAPDRVAPLLAHQQQAQQQSYNRNSPPVPALRQADPYSRPASQQSDAYRPAAPAAVPRLYSVDDDAEAGGRARGDAPSAPPPPYAPCGASADGAVASLWQRACCRPRTALQQGRAYLCCVAALAALIMLIAVLANIRVLGPDDQVVIHYYDGKGVMNGPGTKLLHPFHKKEWRKATQLGPLEYALIKDHLSGELRHVVGPTLLFLGAYEQELSTKKKIVLKNDQYTRLVEERSGVERVLTGPQTVVPEPTETSNGTEQAVFLDKDSAALVLDERTGQQRLVSRANVTQGTFFPAANEHVLEVRSLILLPPHKAIVIRDSTGALNIYSGAANNRSGTSFFLPPHSEVVKMIWSAFGLVPEPEDDTHTQDAVHKMPTRGENQVVTKVSFAMMDLRGRMGNFQYEVRTNDNVKLMLTGVLFWRIKDVPRMIANTPDPSGEVWQHSRSALIQAVSKVKLAVFMDGFNQIVMDAFREQQQDGFYAERGLEVISMELTRYEPVDAKTAEILLEIIQETTNRINRLQAQESENEVRAAALDAENKYNVQKLAAQNDYDAQKMTAEIVLEQQRTELIRTRAENDRVGAAIDGEAEGLKLGRDAAAFIDQLNVSMPSVDGRVELYKMHKTLQSQENKAQHLANGTAKLFLTPADMDLRMDMRD